MPGETENVLQFFVMYLGDFLKPNIKVNGKTRGQPEYYYFFRAEFLIEYMLDVFPAPTPPAQQVAAGTTPETAFVN